MLSLSVKKMIELKYGTPIRYAKDADLLAVAISKECKCKISGSTLKRLFGLIGGAETPRMWTLDIIALYLDHESWDSLMDHITGNSKSIVDKIEVVHSKGLKKGKLYKISFGKRSCVTIEHIGRGSFVVLEEKALPINKLDIIEVEKMQLHIPLVIKQIKRGDEILDKIMIGKVTGVTDITELNESYKIVSSDKIHINSAN